MEISSMYSIIKETCQIYLLKFINLYNYSQSFVTNDSLYTSLVHSLYFMELHHNFINNIRMNLRIIHLKQNITNTLEN